MRANPFHLPIALAQALWVVLKTKRLPEASGPRSGVSGNGPQLRLLIIGDSSAAGVGTDHQDTALAGSVTAHLADTFEVHWTIVAKSGATAGHVADMLHQISATPIDAAIVTCGINDAKNGGPRRVWQRDYAKIIETLQTRFSAPLIIASGLPAVENFPLLPNPLRRIISDRTKRFDQDLQTFAAHNPNVTYLSMEFADDPTLMAPDNFHPGPQIYKAWGAAAASIIKFRHAPQTNPAAK